MSLVGPRPLLVEYLDRYTPSPALAATRCGPASPGLAQVSGRNALSWEEKFALDVEYVEGRSLRLDASILARTIGLVLRRENIGDDAGPTMTVFTARGSGEIESGGDP